MDQNIKIVRKWWDKKNRKNSDKKETGRTRKRKKTQINKKMAGQEREKIR